MNNEKEEGAAMVLSPEEQELKELLDRVLVASTTQPLRDDLSRALAQVQSAVEFSIMAVHKRLTNQIIDTQEQGKDLLEGEFVNLKRRSEDDLEQAVGEIASKVAQEAAKNREALSQAQDKTESALREMGEMGESLRREVKGGFEHHSGLMVQTLSELNTQVKTLATQQAASSRRATVLQWVVLTVVALQLSGSVYLLLQATR